jgi:hypothetical protein
MSPMLSDITSGFDSRVPGVASFETFATECMGEMKSDPANASIYLMLGLAAKQFSDQLSDQPATVAEAEDRKAQMMTLARAAEAALGDAADNKISVLNDIALKNFSPA